LDPITTKTAYSSSASSARAARDEAPQPPRHLKVTGAAPAFGFERCEDVACSVASDGTASSCGRLACPSCGCGGTNLTTVPLLDAGSATSIGCSCGYAWVRTELRSPALSLTG
jgi:hypothetical protein